MFAHVLDLKKRPFIYALFLSVGFLFLLTFLESLPSIYFFGASALLYLLLVLELYLAANHYHVLHKKNAKTIYELEHHKSVQYLHHLVFPSALYFSLVFFVYFNNQPSMYLLMIISCFALFYILFENIYAFYRHEFSLTKSTNYIYDLVSSILAFLAVNSVLNWYLHENLDVKAISVLAGLIILLLGLFSVARHAFIKSFLIAIVVIFITDSILIYALLKHSSMNVMSIAALSSGILIMFNSFLTHYLEKSLKKDVVYEYFLIGLLILSLLYLYGV